MHRTDRKPQRDFPLLQNQNCRIVFRSTAFPEMPLPATGSDAYFRTGFRKR